jgi:hypothetical protein
MGATITGGWLNVEGADNLSFHIQWASANAVGVFSVQGSNAAPTMDSSTRLETPAATPAAVTIYTEATTNPNSNNGTHGIPLTDCAYRWVRLIYTRTSGTGTLNVAFMGKGI